MQCPLVVVSADSRVMGQRNAVPHGRCECRLEAIESAALYGGEALSEREDRGDWQKQLNQLCASCGAVGM